MALSRHHAALSRPLNVEEIVQEAQNFEFNPNRPLQQWIRAARMLLTEATVCEDEGNIAQAYLYIYRHAELVLAKLPQHPDYRNPQFKAELSQARKTLQKNLVKMEEWKPRINQEHERYTKIMARRDAERRLTQNELDEEAVHSHSRRGSYDMVGAMASTTTLNAHQDRRFAVDLAQKEIRRRDASKRSTHQAGISPHTRMSRRPTNFDNISSYNLPPPSIPSKQALSPPPLPSKNPLSAPALPPKPSTSTSNPTQRYTFAPTATTESGSPLRPLLLPPSLRSSFLKLASTNTAHNLETCGILAATLISNALFITHLILPEQTSTPNTCDTTPAGDAALFSYVDSHALLVVGWIHTHPSQTCFLSSRDLHTSAGYQVMLPESIAIVCAPGKDPDWGVFRLTEPPGLDAILGCTQTSAFHPHQEGRLYTDALGGVGHVVEGPGLEFQVVDLRDGRGGEEEEMEGGWI
ncbi:uncharacterized protein MYCGRDRAFT_50144 [Zymoseptoria tritici IPO323]|uniref:MPN domain-containing protein n=1 Tax=Zymoseptoria tritici (strain CBS 115943 / IPO323) TaxID=336722 RepID=F9XM48_ZYMTI|nr:uncharacterized protein MYCGRDRAFT_50144 [Zymoseptoria tritici IPO323]EGP83512.1 hypothetical protein MYCGRDRAFT_50144 [Zymoseptoria tritici IPO323]